MACYVSLQLTTYYCWNKVLIIVFSIAVIIESMRGLPPINEDSIIFKEDRQAAGKVCVKCKNLLFWFKLKIFFYVATSSVEAD